MASGGLSIGFVRRGYSSSGGAEAYLKRLAAGVTAAGHEAQLFTTAEWPQEEWPFGPITRVRGESPLRFADELEELRKTVRCDLLMSLERVWACDVYRAGDGVHRAWLKRRATIAGPLRRVADAISPKHVATLKLEEALFGRRSAARVIANSHMVKTEIAQLYGYPATHIDLVPNGVPVEQFRAAADQRAHTRSELGLTDNDIAVLFVGSGWERKGLRFAIRAVEALRDERVRLLVAGKGNQETFGSPAVRFLGVRHDLSALYAAADVFLLPTIYDPFSNASLEAIAAGIPVITTRANGCAEIMVEGQHGSIVERPDDVPALTRCLRFWCDAERRADARPRLLELATRYDIAVNVQRTLDILLQVAARAESTSG
jgi:UDP-glucose:(heptosyl)LPS alpha-1,3-glucosyltransferase